MRIGEANLDEVFLAAGLGDRRVVEFLDDFVADVAGLKTVLVRLRSR